MSITPSSFKCVHTYLVAGGLPLAAFFTSDERESTLKHALQLVKECLPEHAFCDCGVQAGPQLFLTDNKLEERVAVSFVWPQPILLSCILYVSTLPVPRGMEPTPKGFHR